MSKRAAPESSRSRRRPSPSSSAEDSGADSEEERRRADLKERDAFSDRLKKKDEGKTRNLVEASERKGYEEAAKRLRMEHEDRERIMPQLRIQSRRKYLEKRKDDKVAELEADINDDEYLFDDNV